MTDQPAVRDILTPISSMPSPNWYSHLQFHLPPHRVRHTDVFALNGIPGSAEAETDIFVPSSAALAHCPRLGRLAALVVEEDVRLLLVCALALDSQLGSHDCGRNAITVC